VTAEETTALGRRRVTSGAALLAAFTPAQLAIAAPLERRAFTAPQQDGGFSLDVPGGWEQLQLAPEARDVVGVFASWRDPDEASNTLGVYITPVSEQWTDIRSAGTLQQRAAQLASAAPGQKTQAARERVDASGQRFYEIETLVGGGTAGRFGGAVEVLSETVYSGRRLQARATASLYSWRIPGTRDMLRSCVASFTVQH
jgi:hypothetical protein